jgi:hypothetical protein
MQLLPDKVPVIVNNPHGEKESLMVMNAAAFHKTPAVVKFLYEAEPSMLIALIPPGLTSYLQPLNTAG